MKVVHVGEYVSGGVATYLRTLVNQQIKNKDISEIIIFKSSKNSEELSFNSAKVQVIEYDYERSVLGILRLLALWQRIVEMRPDIVHLHSTFAGLLRVRNIFWHSKFKVIYCAHGWAFTRDSSGFKNRLFAGIERVLAYGTDAIINISPSEQSSAEGYGLPREKMMTINNAVEIPEVLPQRMALQGPLKLLFVGRFDRQKGVDVLIDAARELPDVEFKLGGHSVVGGFDIEKQELPANVELLGWLSSDQVSRYMLKADAVIIPSRWEGFGLVALEAMKNQCAVLASDVGGLANIVQDGINGFLFAPDDLEAIVAAVKGTSRNELSNLGRNAQNFVQTNYDAKQMEREVFDLYR